MCSHQARGRAGLLVEEGKVLSPVRDADDTVCGHLVPHTLQPLELREPATLMGRDVCKYPQLGLKPREIRTMGSSSSPSFLTHRDFLISILDFWR